MKELGISLKNWHGRVWSNYRVDDLIRNNYYIVIGYSKKEKTLYVRSATEKEMKD